MNNFDRISSVYDLLASIVFGRSIRRAQTLFLKEISQGGHVLVLGGGTGWLLAELLSLNPNCQVVYIDASMKMVEMAKKKAKGSKNVFFVHGTENSIPRGIRFDAIITHFYLDLFAQESCDKIVSLIRGSCHNRTLWLACDFINKAWWHTAMLFIMYTFFRVVSGLNVKELPDWKKSIMQSGFVEIRTKSFSKGFISSALFQLNDVSMQN